MTDQTKVPVNTTTDHRDLSMEELEATSGGSVGALLPGINGGVAVDTLLVQVAVAMRDTQTAGTVQTDQSAKRAALLAKTKRAGF